MSALVPLFEDIADAIREKDGSTGNIGAESFPARIRAIQTTESLTKQPAKIWTPTTIDQTIPAETYITGTQTIKGDSNLIASNIKSGVSIFGIDGNLSTGTVNQYSVTMKCVVKDTNFSGSFYYVKNSVADWETIPLSSKTYLIDPGLFIFYFTSTNGKFAPTINTGNIAFTIGPCSTTGTTSTGRTTAYSICYAYIPNTGGSDFWNITLNIA